MHELSIALSILKVAEEEMARQGGGKLTAIHLKVGPLSGVVPEALRGAFALARETSALSSADLLIEEVPVTVYCPRCAAERPAVSIQDFSCLTCGALTPEIVRGHELEVCALEIDS
jgi:hydrogenase nickel incorporation protein HypA/HybF